MLDRTGTQIVSPLDRLVAEEAAKETTKQLRSICGFTNDQVPENCIWVSPLGIGSAIYETLKINKFNVRLLSLSAHKSLCELARNESCGGSPDDLDQQLASGGV